jgi:predicted nucleic acid-binding protein
MPKAILIISDSSPLIALADIDRLEILKQLYGRVYITDIVRSEIKADLPEWIEITKEYDPILYNTLQLQLDKGEASAIALALKNPDSTLIIDESRGRRVAKSMKVRITGLLGIILRAKRDQVIESGKEILDELAQHGFWLSEKVKRDFLDRLGED